MRMIKLDIQEYCHNCPNFEAEVLKSINFKHEVGFSIRCEHRHICKNIQQYLNEKNRAVLDATITLYSEREDPNERTTD